MSDWIIWPIGLTTWLIVGWIAFAHYEIRALQNPNDPRRTTLSNWVYTLGSKFPLSIFALGLAIGLFWGGLAVHFYWHFCPAGSLSAG